MEGVYKLRRSGTHTVVQFQTPTLMNAQDMDRVSAALFRFVDDDKPSSLILDFTKVQFLSSQAVGFLIQLNKKLNGTGAGGDRFILCGVGPQLMQLLKITRLERILNIKPTLREALGR